jgi:hypothetical protein
MNEVRDLFRTGPPGFMKGNYSAHDPKKSPKWATFCADETLPNLHQQGNTEPDFELFMFNGLKPLMQFRSGPRGPGEYGFVLRHTGIGIARAGVRVRPSIGRDDGSHMGIVNLEIAVTASCGDSAAPCPHLAEGDIRAL